MPGITSLEVENFRCFKKLHVDGLSPVTLFVGANNAGKSALLEAIEAVVSEGSGFVLYRSSIARGEFQSRRRLTEDLVEIDPRHWFHGHRLDDGVAYRIHAEGGRELNVARSIRRVPPDYPSPPFVPGGFMLTNDRPSPRSTPSLPPLPLTAEGLLGATAWTRFAAFGLRLRPPVGFVTTDRLLPSDLVPLWSEVVLTPGEERTIAALRLVEPALDRLAISGSGDSALAQVLLHGDTAPVPLGSLGEGVSRLLILALHLAATKGGFLLVDEIENGLHWSVLPRVWRFLIETARALDVQVFVTTHSKDCLESLAKLHGTDPPLAERVSVHRLEAGRETSVRFSASRVAEYVDMDMETR